jgi:hypothetical protein
MNRTDIEEAGTKPLLLGLFLAVSFLAPPQTLLAAGPAPVNLGSTAPFTILSGAAITTTGGGIITGNVGASPIAGSAIHVTAAQVHGITYAVDASGPAGSLVDPSLLTTAKGDLTAAYNDAAGRTPIPTGPFLNPGAGNIGGLNLVPGLYKFTSTALISGASVTLTGGPADVWIFQITKDLEVASGMQVILAGGAQAGNVFWQVGTSATIGTSAAFQGTILASQAVTMDTSSTMVGRALAFTAGVTFDGASASLPAAVVLSGQGSLQVTIAPTNVAGAGAFWQVSGDATQFPGGATSSNLSAGYYTVSFTSVSGWNTPADQAVTIASGAITTVSGLYTPSNAPSDVLILVTNGSGTIQHSAWPASLVNGKKYTVTASPAANNVFSDWVGGTTQPYSVLSTSASYTFTMQSNLVLVANFVTNLFLPMHGVYNGLFAAAGGVTVQTAGMLKGLTVGSTGTYSGTLLINGQSQAISGSFDQSGQGVSYILRTASQGGPLSVAMTLNGNTQPLQVTGTVSGIQGGAPWTATLVADLASNGLPSGQYTMLIPPDDNNAPPNSSPGGDGYAVIVNNAGTVGNPSAARATIAGALADGTAFNQTVAVSAYGFVPIYANLYAGKGLLLGWINLQGTGAPAVSLTWIHPPLASGLYRRGFTNTLTGNQILLSPWSDPPANIFAATNLSFLNTMDNATTLMDFTLTIGNNFKLGEVSDAKLLSGSINPKTGLLTVTIGDGASKLTGHGAMLLNSSSGGGYFLDRTNAQAIRIEP